MHQQMVFKFSHDKTFTYVAPFLCIYFTSAILKMTLGHFIIHSLSHNNLKK